MPTARRGASTTHRLAWPPPIATELHESVRPLIQKDLHERSLSHPPDLSLPFGAPPREDRTCVDRGWMQTMNGILMHNENTITDEWATGMLRAEMRTWVRFSIDADEPSEFTNRTLVYKPTRTGRKTEVQVSEVHCAREGSDEPLKCSAREFWNFVTGGLMSKRWDGPRSSRPPSGWKSEKDLDRDELLQVARSMSELPPGFPSPPIMKPAVDMAVNVWNPH